MARLLYEQESNFHITSSGVNLMVELKPSENQDVRLIPYGGDVPVRSGGRRGDSLPNVGKKIYEHVVFHLITGPIIRVYREVDGIHVPFNCHDDRKAALEGVASNMFRRKPASEHQNILSLNVLKANYHELLYVLLDNYWDKHKKFINPISRVNYEALTDDGREEYILSLRQRLIKTFGK